MSRHPGAVIVLLALAACAAAPSGERSYPPLWLVEHAQSSGRVWLFGTVHTLPPGKSDRLRSVQRIDSHLSSRLYRPEWVSPAIYKALTSSEKLVVELDPSPWILDGNRKLLLSAQARIEKVFGADFPVEILQPLSEYRLDDDLLSDLKQEAEVRDISMEMLQQMSMPAVLLVLSTLPVKRLDELRLPGAEDWLVSVMKVRDREITGLETADLRVKALVEIFSESPQVEHERILRDFLATSISTSRNLATDLELLYQYWLEADIEQKDRYRALYAKRFPEIYRAFIQFRNEQWLDEIRAYLHSNERVFIAVGEGHLTGPGNLRELLAEQGFNTRRVH